MPALVAPLVMFHKKLGDLLPSEPGLAKMAAANGCLVRISTLAAFLPMVSLMENVVGESGVRFSRVSQDVSLSGNFQAVAKASSALAPSKKQWVLNPKRLKPWHHWIDPDGAE